MSAKLDVIGSKFCSLAVTDERRDECVELMRKIILGDAPDFTALEELSGKTSDELTVILAKSCPACDTAR